MRTSWLPITPTSDFSLSNLPFGVITTAKHPDHPHIAVAVGDHALDLHAFSHLDSDPSSPLTSHPEVFRSPTLNAFAALGRPFHRATRAHLQEVLASDTRLGHLLRDNEAARAQCLVLRADLQNRLPLAIGDYTDFYAGLNHAFNVGVLFRGEQNALQPNYRHLPVGYHGRASSVVVSGTKIRRPWGQVLDAETKQPRFQQCARLDLELELGAFVCRPSELGQPVPIAQAEEYIFGFVLLNDWSARDIQTWEYAPLGPFNSKNFGTTISPWVVLADALEPFRCAGLANSVDTMPYLRESRKETVHAIELEVDLISEFTKFGPELWLLLTCSTAGKSEVKHTLTKTSASNVIFSFPQMLAHHTITGCSMRTGDLLGSGTISGTEPGSAGSLLEQSKGGKVAIKLADSSESRKFLEDGDTVVIRGWCQKPGFGRVGFGECRGTIEPAIELSV